MDLPQAEDGLFPGEAGLAHGPLGESRRFSSLVVALHDGKGRDEDDSPSLSLLNGSFVRIDRVVHSMHSSVDRHADALRGVRVRGYERARVRGDTNHRLDFLHGELYVLRPVTLRHHPAARADLDEICTLSQGKPRCLHAFAYAVAGKIETTIAAEARVAHFDGQEMEEVPVAERLAQEVPRR